MIMCVDEVCKPIFKPLALPQVGRPLLRTSETPGQQSVWHVGLKLQIVGVSV
jgi:hypothetical protein